VVVLLEDIGMEVGQALYGSRQLASHDKRVKSQPRVNVALRFDAFCNMAPNEHLLVFIERDWTCGAKDLMLGHFFSHMLA
jgi:hypothetical protein